MLLPPYDVILSWPTPNYVDPPTRGPALVIVNSVFISLTILTVAARLYTRIVIKRWFGIDDVFIILALFFACGLTAVVLLANRTYGWDRHVWDIPFEKFGPTSKIAMTAKIVFTAAATFTRLSLHCFYYRLVSDSGKPWFQWLIHFNVAYTIGIFISFIFIAIFICIPISSYWTIGAPPDTCMDEGVVTLVCGIINCIADLLTTITPIPLVLNLHLPLRQRLAVAFLFGMGIIVTAAGIVRTWYIYRSLFDEYDQTWYSYPLWIAATVEIDLGVICASAPVLKPLLMKIPFNLSATLVGVMSFKKSISQSSNTPTPGDSATLTSNHGSAPPSGVPELATDRGQSHGMRHWADAEPGLMEDELDRNSRETTPEAEDVSQTGITRFLDKLRSKSSPVQMDRDMAITMTSQVEHQIEPAGPHSPRYDPERNGELHQNHIPIPLSTPVPNGNYR